MKRAKKKKLPQRQTCQRLGILSPYGNIWTRETFETRPEAEAHLKGFWSGIKEPPDLRRFKIVPVRLTICVLPPR